MGIPAVTPPAAPAAESLGPAAASFDRGRQRLWWRICRRLPVVRKPIGVGPWTFDIACVPDEDWACARLEQAARTGQADEPRWQPYWIIPWESSQALAAHLLRQPLDHMWVLDLGCGVGLAGTVAAACGARVLLVDAVPEAILLARWNSWPWKSRAVCRCLDWRNGRLTRRFDWIIGADILYDAKDWPYLHDFWLWHLAPEGKVLLSEPTRPVADTFAQWAAANGWGVHEPPAVVIANRHIRFFQLERRR
ncbi:MAG: hypothetical protein KatS3mg110_3892 [Pirellulaceae bacterium]|nr:MAG: hypothetical protein KatS3mg110_3892 [Pirellulaceae bacterium]